MPLFLLSPFAIHQWMCTEQRAHSCCCVWSETAWSWHTIAWWWYYTTCLHCSRSITHTKNEERNNKLDQTHQQQLKNESQHKAILHPMICHEFAKNVRCISIRQFEIVENRPILAWNDVVNVFKLDTMYTQSVSYVHHLPHCCCEIQTHSIQPPFTAYALVHLRVCACMSLAATFYSATT